jgi:predicted secreted protein
MRRVLVAVSMLLPCLFLAASCDDRNPVGPSSSATLDQFVQGLRQQGLSVSLAGEISSEDNRFFSVPAHKVRVNAAQVNAFVYQSAEIAAAEAVLISRDGQPSPTTRVTWVSTPHFYRQGALIVLYVGCAADIVQALHATVGAPLAVGPTPCSAA